MDWTPVLNALVALVATLVAAVAASLQPSIKAFIASKTTAHQRSTISRLADEAVHLAQAAGIDPVAKKVEAVRYVTDALAKYGVVVDEAEVGDAVEAALAYAKDVFHPIV